MCIRQGRFPLKFRAPQALETNFSTEKFLLQLPSRAILIEKGICQTVLDK